MPREDIATQWRQCDVLRGEHVEALASEGLVPTSWAHEGSSTLVISHSCDIGFHDLDAEPTVELLRLRHLSDNERDGNFMYGKNPRRYHLAIEQDHGALWVDVDLRERTDVPRGQLLKHQPDSERTLAQRDARGLAIWRGKRYWRQGFPDEFNRRVAPAATKVRDLLKKQGGRLLSGIYLLLQSDEELPASEPYTLSVRGTLPLPDSDAPANQTSALGTIQELAKLLSALNGVEVEEWEVVSEAEMSLDDLNFYKRWDYDDLSVRAAGSNAPPIPEA